MFSKADGSFSNLFIACNGKSSVGKEGKEKEKKKRSLKMENTHTRNERYDKRH